jgi:nucleotide-binding universal stress UspA family protein
MNILIAYDGSSAARSAIDDLRVAGLPEKTTATVMTAADVLPVLVESKDIPRDAPRVVITARANAARAMAEAQRLAGEGAKRVSELFPAWRVSNEAVPDSPYWAFVTHSNEASIDLIVLGSRGRSAFQSFVLGSVSQNVLHYAKCSVRIGRSDGAPPPAMGSKNIVAFDGSAGGASAASAVANRSWPKGSEVRLVTAVHGQTLSKLIEAPGTEEKIQGMVQKAASHLRGAGLIVSTELREGDPKDVILDEARTWGAHSIFMGARGLTSMERAFLGSVSSAVAARAHCSVEVVRSAT